MVATDTALVSVGILNPTSPTQDIRGPGCFPTKLLVAFGLCEVYKIVGSG